MCSARHIMSTNMWRSSNIFWHARDIEFTICYQQSHFTITLHWWSNHYESLCYLWTFCSRIYSLALLLNQQQQKFCYFLLRSLINWMLCPDVSHFFVYKMRLISAISNSRTCGQCLRRCRLLMRTDVQISLVKTNIGRY